MKKRLLSGILLISIVLGAGVCSFLYTRATDIGEETIPENVQRQTIGTVIEYQGKQYRYNNRNRNVLILGIDQNEEFQASYKAGEAGQADFLLLLSTNKDTGKTKILEIHRNSMTSVDHYDDSGSYIQSVNQQITLQYAYGIGGKQSCRATEKTVSELLYNLEIDGYIAINAKGIEEITDALGGVDVTITDDYTALDERYRSGSTLHMDGASVKTFIQKRDVDEFDSATDRMKRQTDFMVSLIQQFSGTSTEELYKTLQQYMNTYIITDLSVDEVNVFMSEEFDTEDILTVPGKTIMGEQYEEYIVDEEALQDLIISNYYKEYEE